MPRARAFDMRLRHAPSTCAFDMRPLCQAVAIADTGQANLELASKRFGVPGYSTWKD